MHKIVARGITPVTATQYVATRLRERAQVMLRRLSSDQRPLPDFLIIGGQKCGTSSLYRYLISHPQIEPSLTKEVHYFDLHYGKGEAWYSAHFPRCDRADERGLERGFLTGESSPYYLMDPRVPKRVADLIPDVKLIVLLRNPIDRAFSHYHSQVRRGREKLSFEDAIDTEPERLAGEEERLLADPSCTSSAHRHFSYTAKGIYIDQIERWLEVFDRERLLVLNTADLRRDAPRSVARVESFLGLEPHEIEVSTAHNVGSYAPMHESTRARLREFFRPHNERLFAFLGEEWTWD
ncbi:Sulfotransferase domain protein [Maioricimonas rarisocia]|uniref:Sulfotransferase domain protein n=1 Tax=Maioricimonas rarisocia TaxID=2528026 RepID=A0A517ZD72_9PLAN|nr:sulfotransferase domain-containing protein [Maioricimonas rarisocia]QDU40417.1 Sulfotransferase domain protein [Maioricimonas rarisocia]